MVFLRKINYLIPVLLLTLASACGTGSSDGEEELRYFEFSDQNESFDYSFVAGTSDPAVIEKVEAQLELPVDERNLHINGDIARGDGGFNTGWSWHFVPGEWDLVEVSTEVCDGRPQMVEEDLDYWVDQVGSFCPWSSVVVQEVQVQPG